MTGNIKNVFISHVHADDAKLGELKDLLGNYGMTIRDGSINASKPNNANSPQYIKSEILAPQIQWAGTMLVLITPDTKNSEWVNWEIEYAHKQDMRIVGVWANGEAGCEVPEALEKYADCIVGWRGQAIVDAINGERNDWESADGAQRAPWTLKRHPC